MSRGARYTLADVAKLGPKAQEEVRAALYPTHENNSCSQIPDAQPKPHKAAALERAVPGEAQSVRRAHVRFVGYRARLLDPDNFAGSVKDLLDGLRHSGLLRGDDPSQITLTTEQIKVRTRAEEKTVIEIDLYTGREIGFNRGNPETSGETHELPRK